MSFTSRQNENSPIHPTMAPESPLGYSSGTPRGNYTPASPLFPGQDGSRSPSGQDMEDDTPESPPHCEISHPSPNTSSSTIMEADNPSSPPAESHARSPSPQRELIPQFPQVLDPPLQIPILHNNVVGLAASPRANPIPPSPLNETPASSPRGNDTPESSPESPPVEPNIEDDTPPQSPVNDDTPPDSPPYNNPAVPPLVLASPDSPPQESQSQEIHTPESPTNNEMDSKSDEPPRAETPDSPPDSQIPGSPPQPIENANAPHVVQDTPGSPSQDTPSSPPESQDQDTPGSPPFEEGTAMSPSSFPIASERMEVDEADSEKTDDQEESSRKEGASAESTSTAHTTNPSPPPSPKPQSTQNDSSEEEEDSAEAKEIHKSKSAHRRLRRERQKSSKERSDKQDSQPEVAEKEVESPSKKADASMEIDPEDLEEGEIEDDEEEEEGEADEAPPPKKKDKGSKDKEESSSSKRSTDPFSKIFGGDKENQSSSRKEKKEEKKSSSGSRHGHGHSKDKEKESSSSHKDRESKDKKDKEREGSSRSSKDKEKKKRKHSESNNGLTDEEEMTGTTPKSSRPSRGKKSRNSQESGGEMDGMGMSGGAGPEEDDDSYLFVRGGSPPSNLSAKQLTLQSFAGYSPGGNELDEFGRGMYDEDSDEERRGGRRHRSPLNRRRRQDNRDDVGGRGGRRPPIGGAGGGRKDEVSKGIKSDIICAYYMQGKCQKSHEECSFSHNAVPPRKMELCKFWMMDCCAKREKCLYLHNDFPCKFYHTGLVCKQGERCKFSHKPLNEITKAVLLKHIETAPKEILGDFPRLNRNGALNLINKMEQKILGALHEQERKEKELEAPRRTRWEQPTRDDQEKLQELMEEAGIGGYYRETLECHAPPTSAPPPHSQPPNILGGLQYIPPPQAPLIQPPTPSIVQNAALASVLANLNIPSSTIQPLVATVKIEDTKMASIPKGSPVPATVAVKQEPKDETENPYWNSKTTGNAEPPPLHEPPEHLPPMQKELFLRIQQQQLKNENKTVKDESDEDERADDVGWYSSDEDEGGNKGSNAKTPPVKSLPRSDSQQQGIDISSVISSIRKTVEPPSKLLDPRLSRAEQSNSIGRGDVDLRQSSQSTNSSGQPHSQDPFGDTDFRLPSSMRQDLMDIDLRLSGSPGTTSDPIASTISNPLAFFNNKLPTGPATEIDASINSHPPVQYKLRLVLGVEAPNYRYIRHTLTPSQILMDPRLGPRQGQQGANANIPDPASPPQTVLSTITPAIPATIPSGDVVVDPRVRRGQASQGQAMQQQQQQQTPMNQHMGSLPLPQSAMPGLLGDPRFPRDPRTLQIGAPTGWPTDDINMQQAQAALFMTAHQQALGIPPLFPFPNPAGFPFIPQDFGGMGSGGGGGRGGNKSHFNQGHGGPRGQFGGNHGGGGGRGRPTSSWERFSQQQRDPDGGTGLSP